MRNVDGSGSVSFAGPASIKAGVRVAAERILKDVADTGDVGEASEFARVAALHLADAAPRTYVEPDFSEPTEAIVDRILRR